MGSLFDPDALLWRWCSRLLDVMVLSVLWLFCSLPVLTAGAASAALYDAAVHGVRRDEPGAYARFLRTFRRELKTAVPAFLPWGAALPALLWWGQFIGTEGQSPAFILLSAAACELLLLAALGTVSWMFPLLSRFEFSVRGLHRAAWQFFFAHLPSSVLLAAMLAGSAWACWRFLFPVFFLPCAEALAASVLIERAFRKHQ